VRVDTPEPVTLLGLSEDVRPLVPVSTSPTFEMKLSILVTLIVEEQEGPLASSRRNGGSAKMSKSGPLTLTLMKVDP